MRLLCIDTSSQTESLALTQDGTIVAEVSVYRKRGHASELLQDLDKMMVEAGWSWTDLTGIAVGLGPGGFTSLRIGLATAKSLAYSLDVPLFGATTMDILTSSFAQTRVVALIDAKRGEVYALHPTSGLQCVAPDVLDQYFDPSLDYFFCGDGAVQYAEILRRQFPTADINLDEDKNRPKAARLAELIDPDKPEHLSRLQPKYVRPSDAELTYPDGFPDAVQQFQF